MTLLQRGRTMPFQVPQCSRPSPCPQGFGSGRRKEIRCNSALRNKMLSSEEWEERKVWVTVHCASFLCTMLNWTPWGRRENQWIGFHEKSPWNLCGRSPMQGSRHLKVGVPSGRKVYLSTEFPGQCQNPVWQQHGNQFVENSVNINSFHRLLFSCVRSFS